MVSSLGKKIIFPQKDTGQAAACLFTSAELHKRNIVLEDYKSEI